MTSTLAIETSCDDTSLGIVRRDGESFVVDQLLAYSQVPDHQAYGGVVPEIASRLHSEQIIKVLSALDSQLIEKVDNICVTTTPGLPGSLVVGKTVAHMLAEWHHKDLIEVNHIHGHIFSLLLERSVKDIKFPMVVLTASGWHNDIYLIEKTDSRQRDSSIELEWPLQQCGPFTIQKLGHTLDDAAGECFDKVSRMLGGPYPGGVWISEHAKKYSESETHDESQQVHFKRIFLSKEWFNFSFSGMKSQVSILTRKREEEGIALTEDLICAVAYEFQEAVVEVLAKKLIKAGRAYGAKTLWISGGVSANDRLFEYANELLKEKRIKDTRILADRILTPTKKIYSTDNAAMIGVAWLLQSTNIV